MPQRYFHFQILEASWTTFSGCKQGGGNVLLFSKHFMDKKYDVFVKDGCQLSNGNVEYLVFWYDPGDDKEYKVVLPKLKFNRKENTTTRQYV
jgi:hypothetical protein